MSVTVNTSIVGGAGGGTSTYITTAAAAPALAYQGDGVIVIDENDKQWVWNGAAYTLGIGISSPLTGYAVGSNTRLTASDTILTAFQNVQGQLDSAGPHLLTAQVDLTLPVVNATEQAVGSTFTVTANTFTPGKHLRVRYGLKRRNTTDLAGNVSIRIRVGAGTAGTTLMLVQNTTAAGASDLWTYDEAFIVSKTASTTRSYPSTRNSLASPAPTDAATLDWTVDKTLQITLQHTGAAQFDLDSIAVYLE